MITQEKLTKAQKLELATNNITNKFSEEIKKNFIKNIMIGWESANRMIVDKIDSGATLEELREFCVKNIENKDTMEKVANKS
jgi:hypothetical protein